MAGLRIVGALQQLPLPDPALAQPVFRRLHDDPAKPLSLTLRRDGDVIDPAAMTVLANHRGRNQFVTITGDQHGRMRLRARKGDVLARIVPRPRNARAVPKRDHAGDIRVDDLANGESAAHGFRIDAPVVARLSRSRCALAASFSA